MAADAGAAPEPDDAEADQPGDHDRHADDGQGALAAMGDHDDEDRGQHDEQGDDPAQGVEDRDDRAHGLEALGVGDDDAGRRGVELLA